MNKVWTNHCFVWSEQLFLFYAEWLGFTVLDYAVGIHLVKQVGCP